MKKRLLFYELIKYLNHKNALLITGMRQVGKTTLMRQVFEEVKAPKLWFDFDNPLDQKIFEDEDYKVIYKRLADMAHKEGRLSVFIDEIQNYPEITKVIKYLIDHYAVKFYLTGSSSFYLKNLFPESLSGRKFLYELPPLSFQEYLYFKDKVTLQEIQGFTLQDAFRKNSIFTHKARIAEYKRNTAEIDAIIEKHTAFEVKLTGTKQDHSKLSTLSTHLGISQSYVISKKFQEQEKFLSPVTL